jgi:hypothetical protein
MSEEKNGVFDGPNGKSSKRIAGLSTAGSGALILIVQSVINYFALPAGNEMIYQIGVTLFVGGMTILGVGVIDKVRK